MDSNWRDWDVPLTDEEVADLRRAQRMAALCRGDCFVRCDCYDDGETTWDEQRGPDDDWQFDGQDEGESDEPMSRTGSASKGEP